MKSVRVERLKGKGSHAGGQRKNKVETAVRLTHEPTGITAQASERRDQAVNQSIALFRLRVNLAIEFRHGFDPKHTPSPLWLGRVKSGRLMLNPSHKDFPSLLAELLDALAAYRYEPRDLAERMQVSATQMIKLLKHEPRALAWVNTEREQRRAHPLR